MKVKVTDGSGAWVVDVPVDIVDDVPVIEGGIETLSSGESVEGNVGLDFGADNGEGKTLVVAFGGEETEITADGTQIAGQHGTLTMNTEGTYSYKADELPEDYAPGLQVDEITVKPVGTVGALEFQGWDMSGVSEEVLAGIKTIEIRNANAFEIGDSLFMRVYSSNHYIVGELANFVYDPERGLLERGLN